MATIEGRVSPTDLLKEFYTTLGIGESDLQEKWRAMNDYVRIPNFSDERKPALYELEQQYLRDKDYNV